MPPDNLESPQNTRPACKHVHTRVIAADNDAQFLECLDCGAILEAGELKESTAFGESLSEDQIKGLVAYIRTMQKKS